VAGVAVRKGRNSRARGNSIEREIAKRLGLRRVGQFGGPDDVAGDNFVAQVKSGGSFPERIWRWLKAVPVNATQTPLVVVVDDGQWADLPSLLALTFAARRLRRDPVVLVVTTRPEGLARLPSGLVRLVQDEGEHLLLGPLDRDEVQRLVEARTGEAVSPVAAERLREHTGGNPLHLATLLDELPVSALLAPGELPSPRSFSTLVLARLGGCSPEVEALVAAAAVLGESTELEAVATVAGLAAPLEALDQAVARGLLAVTRPVPGGSALVGAPHPLVRAAVLHDLPLARRAALHRAAAEVVSGSAGLRHRLLGTVGPDAQLWEDAMAVAAGEAARGAHGTAAALMRQAAGVAPTDERRERSLLEAADRFILAGRLDEATALRPAVEETQPSPRRSFVRGRLAYTSGPRRDTLAHLDDAWCALTEAVGGEDGLRRAGADERELAGRVAAMRAVNSVDRADGAAAIGWCRWALELAPEQAALSSVAHMLAGAYGLSGQLEAGLTELDAICRAAEGAGAAALADARCGRGLLRMWSHDLDGAAADLEKSLVAASAGASFAAREGARLYLAEVRYRQGRWDEAVLHAQTAASVADDSDQVWLAALPHATAARPLAARGHAAAAEHLQRAEAAAHAVGAGVSLVLTRLSAMEVASCQRSHDRVLTLAADLGPFVDERLAPWRASYVESLVAEDRLDDALDVVEQLSAAPSTPLVANDAARATVAVAAALDDPVRLQQATDAGLALDPAVVGTYPRARLELAAGSAWRRRGDRRRAAALLERARARFEELGARPWLDQVDREIAACGLRPARRRAPHGQALTPQEQAVASLVARGLTNREVAAELVVSAKTVEHHLSRVYAKLGVRSRTELAHRARRTDP
jgi:DNA-binding CsgD family transcriptional regulator